MTLFSYYLNFILLILFYFHNIITLFSYDFILDLILMILSFTIFLNMAWIHCCNGIKSI